MLALREKPAALPMPGHCSTYVLQPLPYPTSRDGHHGLPRTIPSPSLPEKLSQTIPGSFIKPRSITQPPTFFLTLPTDVHAAVNYQSVALYSGRRVICRGSGFGSSSDVFLGNGLLTLPTPWERCQPLQRPCSVSSPLGFALQAPIGVPVIRGR